jgi:hypothetical protein
MVVWLLAYIQLYCLLLVGLKGLYPLLCFHLVNHQKHATSVVLGRTQ